MSYERIAEMFGQVFGLELERSTIARALLRLADRAEATYRGLIETIRGSPVGDAIVLRGRSTGKNPVYYVLGQTEAGRHHLASGVPRRR